MKVHEFSVADALLSLKSEAQGLSSREAARRLAEYGPNRVEAEKQHSIWLGLLAQFVQLFSVILWVAAGLAFFAERMSPGQGMARIGYAVVAIIIINGVFSFAQEYRAERTLAALQRLLPKKVRAFRGGALLDLPADQLVVGDVILLEQGDDTPADCRLIEGFGVQVNNAVVTGESMAQPRTACRSDAADILHANNILLAGTSVVAGHGKCLVFATGMATAFGKITHLAQSGRRAVAPLRTELARLSRLIALLAVLIGALLLLIGLATGLPFWEDVIFAIGIIVAMVPEGLLTTLTLALILAAKRLTKRNVLIRHLTSIETLGAATVICTDKTGTLTQNRMRVRQLQLGLLGIAASELEQRPDLVGQYGDLFIGARVCHGLKEIAGPQGRVLQGDPTELALFKLGQDLTSRRALPRRLHEIPFDPATMRQSVIFEADEGRTAVLCCKGAPESVLPLCSDFIEDGRQQRLAAEARTSILDAQQAMAAQGLRVLAFATRRFPIDRVRENRESDLVFQGLVGLEDPLRDGVQDAIRKCHEAGIKVVMVTGDHPQTAAAVAREVGLVRSPSPTVIGGEALHRMTADQLSAALGAPEIIFARVGPAQKLRIVETLRARGEVVAVTGDGVNDAPSLRAAHIGIAMGVAGSDVAKAAADMVLLDDDFASIIHAVEEGRTVFQNIRKFLTYILVHNVAELVPYLAFALFAIPLPLTPVQALAVDMGTDSVTALGLGIEKANPNLMRLQPRRGERLLTWPLALRSYLFLGVIEAATAMAAFFFILHGGGWSYGQSLDPADPLYRRATTACLSAIVVMQIVNVYVCRSSVRSVFSMRWFDNPIIVAGVALEIALVVVIGYTAWGNALLETAPVPGALWVFLMPFAAGMLLLEEIRKWIVRRSLIGTAPG